MPVSPSARVQSCSFSCTPSRARRLLGLGGLSGISVLTYLSPSPKRIALACIGAVLLGPCMTGFAATAWWTPASVSQAQVAKYADTPRWHMDNGLAAENGGTPDAKTPQGLQLIAGSGTRPGVVVAAGTSGIWRRDESGQWQQSLILLPQGLLNGPPRVTAVTAFAGPLSNAIYVATDGQGVLITEDGGESWIRDDLGLPDHVLSLSASSSQRTLYAATNSGLWAHQLQSFPAPPSYQQRDLLMHWLTIVAIALFAATGSIVGLRKICQ